MLVEYYEAVSATSTHLDSYYTEDAVLDVNGIVKQGKGPIDDLYKTTSPFPSSYRSLVATDEH